MVWKRRNDSTSAVELSHLKIEKKIKSSVIAAPLYDVLAGKLHNELSPKLMLNIKGCVACGEHIIGIWFYGLKSCVDRLPKSDISGL